MRGFGCARESGKLVTWHCTPLVVIEREGCVEMEVLGVMDRTSRQSCEECTLRDTVGVEVRESAHGFGNDRV